MWPISSVTSAAIFKANGDLQSVLKANIAKTDDMASSAVANTDQYRVNIVHRPKANGAIAHPGIRAADSFGRTLATAPAGDLVDAATRHHCYELHIGTEHLGWYVWTKDDEWLRKDAAHLEMLLERGPLTS